MTRTLLSSLLFTIALLLPALAQADAAVGAVYAMTNALDGNAIVVYDRAANGTLTLRGRVATGGFGIGDLTEPVDALGSQQPLLLSPDLRLLFAVNAGSDDLSVFRVRRDGLTLVDRVASGGSFPASLTLHGDLLYVLNAGGEGNITGFRVAPDGQLSPIVNSTRSLDVGGDNPPFFLVSPAQVGFSPRGDALVVTVKGTDEIRVYAVNAAGLPSAHPVVNRSHGSTPFGFAFDARDRLLVAEPFGNGAVGQPGASAVSSYTLAANGTITPLTASLDNLQTASCWLVTDGRFAWVTNNATSTISGYAVHPDGTLELLDADGVTAHTGEQPVDLGLTPNGRFLYAVNAGAGTVSAYRVDAFDGSLTELGEYRGLPADDGAVGIAVR